MPPLVIISKASCTPVFVPPFLKTLPLSEAMTTGVDAPVRTAGAWPNTGAAPSARPAAVDVDTNSRRVILVGMVAPRAHPSPEASSAQPLPAATSLAAAHRQASR